MTGGGLSVLIWGRTCRAVLVDKGKTQLGDKGTCTYKHGPKTQEGRMACVQINVYAYAYMYRQNLIQVQTELK